MRILFIGLALLLCGCNAAREDAVRATYKPWIGRLVEDYVRERVEAPAQAVDVAGGRLFLFAEGLCKRSVLGRP